MNKLITVYKITIENNINNYAIIKNKIYIILT